MQIFRQGSLSIFWGDKASCSVSKDAPEFKNFCNMLAFGLELDAFVVLQQEHGAVGYIAPQDFASRVSVYEKKGDYLITNKPGIGISALSADCLPVVFYDPEHEAVGIAHSGWRGTMQNVAGAMLDAMIRNFQATPEHVRVFFGPAARACCYEVSAGFEEEIPAGYNLEELLIKREGKLFFDNALLCKRMLENAGIVAQQINQDFNSCTMCNNQFYSARRDKGLWRNVTVVSLSNERFV